VEPDRVQQRADLAGGPQARDEDFAARVGREIDLVAIDLAVAVQLTGQRDGRRAAVAVTPGHDQLRSSEQVRQRQRGIQFLDQHVVEVEFDVRQHGRADFAVEAAHFLVDALPDADVGTRAAKRLDQLIEQERVDIVANAEGEHPHIGRRGGFGIVQNVRRVGLALGGQPVGQEQDHRRALPVDHPHRLLERAVDVRAAERLQPADPVFGSVDFRDGLEIIGVDPEAGAESDDVEPVARVEVVQHEFGGVARLIPFFAEHRAGLVEHEDHVLGNDPVGIRFDGWGDQQREEPVFVRALAVGEQVHVDLVAGQPVVQDEVALGALVTGFIAGAEGEFALARDGDAVGGRVDRADLVVGLDGHADARLLDRAAGELVGAQGVGVVHQPVLDGE